MISLHRSFFIFIFALLTTGNIISQGKSTDTISVVVKTHQIRDPKKAALLSAAFPRFGQIYNHKWIKLPFVAGAFGACIYGLNFNQKYYTQYSNWYFDIKDGNPNTNRHLDELPPTITPEYVKENLSSFTDLVKARKDYYRRNRDLMIIVTVGVYVINIIDASVDAHLSDFSVSKDLSDFSFSPVFGYFHGTTTAGFSLSYQF